MTRGKKKKKEKKPKFIPISFKWLTESRPATFIEDESRILSKKGKKAWRRLQKTLDKRK
jgi:hypothetical protein